MANAIATSPRSAALPGVCTVCQSGESDLAGKRSRWRHVRGGRRSRPLGRHEAHRRIVRVDQACTGTSGLSNETILNGTSGVIP